MGARDRGRLGRLAVQMAAGGLVCLALVACGDDDSASETTVTASGGSPTSYAILSSEAWSLQEAVDPPEDDPLASTEQPPVDWYSEHVRTVPAAGGTEGQMIRLSGHSASINEAQTALEGLGWVGRSTLWPSTDGRAWVGPVPLTPAVRLWCSSIMAPQRSCS